MPDRLLARPLGQAGGEDRYALYGTKWFTSATTSEMALTLARIDDGNNPPAEGSPGLTLFCVEVQRKDDDSLLGIEVNRLKDKLGTRALPTAELSLVGVPATRLSEPGRGVATIATMLNITRFYNALSSVSGMARATFLARDYASRRDAFGRTLKDHPLHARTLDDLEAELAGGLALCFELADLLGKLEVGTASDEERRRLRGLIPIAKLTLGKQAVWTASEALECFGGAGYIEDTGLPRLVRDAQVLSIWEGTTNVLSLDVLRAEGKDQALSHVLQDLTTRAAALPTSLDDEALQTVRKTLTQLNARLEVLRDAEPSVMEANARRIAISTGYLAEAVYMAETAVCVGDDDTDSSARFARFVSLRLRGPLG